MKTGFVRWLTAAVGMSTFLGFLLAVPGYAAQKAGDNEIQLSGGFNRAQGSDTGTATADVSYAYFLSPSWALGLRQTLSYSFIDDDDDVWTASTVPFLNYHFRGLSLNDRFQPFLGAFAGAVYTEDDATGTIGPNVGFKYFVSDQTFVVARYRYEWFFDELELSSVRNTSDGNHVVTVGFGFVWGAPR